MPTIGSTSANLSNITGSLNLNTIWQQLQTAQKQANDANQKRYNDLIAGLTKTQGQVVGPGGTFDTASQDFAKASGAITGAGGTYDQAMGQLNTLGTTAATRIAQQAQQQGATAQQDLISRGLGNTTIGENVQQQVNQQAEQNLQAANEGIAAQKVNLLSQQAGTQAGLAGQAADLTTQKGSAQINLADLVGRSMESLTQAGPDLGMFAGLLSSAAQQQAQDKKATISDSGNWAAAGLSGGGMGSGSSGGISQQGGGGGNTPGQAGTYGSGSIGGGFNIGGSTGTGAPIYGGGSSLPPSAQSSLADVGSTLWGQDTGFGSMTPSGAVGDRESVAQDMGANNALFDGGGTTEVGPTAASAPLSITQAADTMGLLGQKKKTVTLPGKPAAGADDAALRKRWEAATGGSMGFTSFQVWRTRYGL